MTVRRRPDPAASGSRLILRDSPPRLSAVTGDRSSGAVST